MHDRFIGNPNIPQVRQPEDSELCFAAVAASATGERLEEVHRALFSAFVSAEDGMTSPPLSLRSEVPLTTGDRSLIIDTIQGWEQEADDTIGVINNIDTKLRAGIPVALLYKCGPDIESGMHWVLLTGYTYARDTDIVDGVVVMDPKMDTKVSMDPVEIVDMIDRSMRTDGVFAYGLEMTA